MSIPKEPRQLMINLMYLVLTALLALNVSAEVMNAFFTLDEGNKASIATVNSQLDQTVDGLNSLLEDDSKQKFRPISPAIEEVRTAVSDFNGYINEMRDVLIDAAGNRDGELNEGDYTLSYGKSVPKGKKNKDVTTRMLVTGYNKDGQAIPPIGPDLKTKIIETKDKMLNTFNTLVTEHGKAFGFKDDEVKTMMESMEANLTLGIDDETWKESKDKKSWSDFKFRQMPLAAVLPLLSQMQSDAKSSEAALVNKMAELAGGRVVEFDSFFPVVQAEKAYVIKGEPFKATVSVGTYSSSINPADITITANGSRLKVGSDGKAEYSTGTSSIGEKTLKLAAKVRNPLTGEVSEGEATYKYEVGERSVAVSADKMNVFYIGVANPISVSAAGVSSNKLKVGISGGGGSLKKRGSNSWDVTVSRPGEATISVSGEGLNARKEFRVKRIPDPTPVLGRGPNAKGGAMGNGEFKAQLGLAAILENFDFDAKCNIQGYELTRVPKRQDPISNVNRGGRYDDRSLRLVRAAKPGDTYYFDNVKAKCPGDPAGRRLSSIVFTIR